MSHKRYPTSTEVAQLAGVSQSAVSRAFTPGASISDKTRARVMAAADSLGFRPSLIPQILLTDRSGIVAVVVGALDNPFYGRVLETFATRLRETGRESLLVSVDDDHALDAAVVRLAQYRVDAIVSALSVLSQGAADTLSRLRLPVVSFNTPVVAERVGAVGSDNRAGGRQAAACLGEAGARHCAYLGGASDSPASLERLAGFRAGLAALGLPEPRVAGEAYTHAGGIAAIEALLADGPAPDGLFCANDLIALGAVDALRRRGLRVPGDAAVIGYDDIPAAAFDAYALTTFDQDIPALVAAALALVDRMSKGEPTAAPVLVPPKLILRGSTRRPSPIGI